MDNQETPEGEGKKPRKTPVKRVKKTEEAVKPEAEAKKVRKPAVRKVKVVEKTEKPLSEEKKVRKPAVKKVKPVEEPERPRVEEKMPRKATVKSVKTFEEPVKPVKPVTPLKGEFSRERSRDYTDDQRERKDFGRDKPFRERPERSDNPDREKRPYERRNSRSSDRPGDGEKRPYRSSDRPDRPDFKKKPYGDDRRSSRPDDREKRPYEKRDDRGSDRTGDGEKRPYRSSDRPDFKKKSYGDDRRSSRPDDGEKRPYRSSDRSDDREKRPYERRDDRGSDRPKRPYEKRDDRSSDRSDDRPKRPYEKRDDRSSDRFDDREKRPYRSSDRPDRPDYKKKPYGDDRPKRPYEKRDDRDSDRSGDREKRPYRSEERADKPEYKKRPYNRDDRRDPESSFDKRKRVVRSGVGEGAQRTQSKDPGMIRLNKYIADAGVCSRREADILITTGAISVNGNIVTELGTKVAITDKVQYGDQTLSREKLRYILLNKPKGFITTTDDPQERKTVMNLIANACSERVYPVGRLDRNTTGLLLFTNDGELATKLIHPKHGIRKIYHVVLEKPLLKKDMITIANGIELDDGMIKVDVIDYIGDGSDKKEVGIELHSGKNRVVRRIFEKLGNDVVKLDRVGFASLTKKNLPRGEWRHLDEKEVSFLKMLS